MGGAAMAAAAAVAAGAVTGAAVAGAAAAGAAAAGGAVAVPASASAPTLAGLAASVAPCAAASLPRPCRPGCGAVGPAAAAGAVVAVAVATAAPGPLDPRMVPTPAVRAGAAAARVASGAGGPSTGPSWAADRFFPLQRQSRATRRLLRVSRPSVCQGQPTPAGAAHAPCHGKLYLPRQGSQGKAREPRPKLTALRLDAHAQSTERMRALNSLCGR